MKKLLILAFTLNTTLNILAIGIEMHKTVKVGETFEIDLPVNLYGDPAVTKPAILEIGKSEVRGDKQYHSFKGLSQGDAQVVVAMKPHADGSHNLCGSTYVLNVHVMPEPAKTPAKPKSNRWGWFKK